MRIIKPPQKLDVKFKEQSLFLAGSIELGKAELWQDRITNQFADAENVVILNPRRDDWDSSWIQSIDNPKFKEQVEWELEAMALADKILMYFDPNTKSPISLLELGLHAKDGSLVVVCPEGFWRK